MYARPLNRVTVAILAAVLPAVEMPAHTTSRNIRYPQFDPNVSPPLYVERVERSEYARSIEKRSAIE